MPNHDKWSHPWTVHTSRLLMFNTSIKKFHETSSWCLNAGKLKNRAYLLWREICTQLHSANISPDILLHYYGRGTCRFLSHHLWSLAGKLFSVLVRSTRTTFTTTVFRCFHILLGKGCYQSEVVFLLAYISLPSSKNGRWITYYLGSECNYA